MTRVYGIGIETRRTGNPMERDKYFEMRKVITEWKGKW